MGGGEADPVDQRRLAAPVEHDQRAGFETEPVQVGVELLQAFRGRVGAARVLHLQLERLPLPGLLAGNVQIGPTHHHVDAAVPEAELPVHKAATVHDPVHERHQDQLRSDLVVDGSP